MPDPVEPSDTATRAHVMTLAILESRLPGATVCPSEVARAIAAGSAWRDAMPEVHAAVDHLLEQGVVQISWKRQPLAVRAGPYRIGRPSER